MKGTEFFREIVLSEFDLEEAKERVRFMQADAMNLKPNFTGYDLIIVPGLLEELSDPSLFLSRIHKRLNKGGYLLIASDYDWDPKKADRDKWPGGFKRDGEPVTSMDGLKEVLASHFELHVDPMEMKQVIKKSSRVEVHRQMEVSIWKKR